MSAVYFCSVLPAHKHPCLSVSKSLPDDAKMFCCASSSRLLTVPEFLLKLLIERTLFLCIFYIRRSVAPKSKVYFVCPNVCQKVMPQVVSLIYCILTIKTTLLCNAQLFIIICAYV